MRVFNNTSYKTIPAEHLVKGIWHLVKTSVDVDKIESIEINDKTFTVFGIECVLLESKMQDKTVSGVVRWFDELSGDGMIRLDNGVSVHFFSCNVEGANSLYPELVTNIHLKQGQRVTATVSADPYLFNSCGLINIRGGK